MTDKPTADAPPVSFTRRLPLVRLSVRSLLLFIAAIGFGLGAWRYHEANRNPQRAWVSRQARAMTAPDPAWRRSAAEGLRSARDDDLPKAVPVLAAAATRDADPSVRRAAVEALASESPVSRGHAADALIAYGPAAQSVLPKLRRLATNPDDRNAAGWVIQAITRATGPRPAGQNDQ